MPWVDLARTRLFSRGFTLEDIDNFAASHYLRDWFVHHLSWAVPTAEIITGIASFLRKNGVSKVHDHFGGSGYWSYLLEQAGLVCTCFDNASTHKFYNEPWHEIVNADSNAVPVPEDVALLLSWVPYEVSAVPLLSKTVAGQIAIFISEGRGGCVSDDATHDFLYLHFDELSDEETGHIPDVPQFHGLHDHLHIYRRKP